MKIFSWMQSKLNGKQVTRNPNTLDQATLKEEFSDWPQSLLAIGTFGLVSNLRADPEPEAPHTPEEEDHYELNQELISYLEEETHPSVCQHLLINRDVSNMLRKDNAIKKKSLTFLLKKIFKSRNRHSFPDPTFEKSRMEKVLRAILNKKIHPQSCTTKAISDKYVVNNKDMYTDDDDQGSIWVKTDSEYIVLEI